MQSSRLQGTGFPKVPNQGPSSAIFPLLFPSRRRNQFVITLCMPQRSRQPYNLQLWGLLGGRDGVREKEREREWERGGATAWRKEGVKKTQEVASSKEEKKALSLLSYLSSSAHQRHKCLIFFSPSLLWNEKPLSHSCSPPPPSFYLCASIRQKHFDKVKHKPNVLGGGTKWEHSTLPTSDWPLELLMNVAVKGETIKSNMKQSCFDGSDWWSKPFFRLLIRLLVSCFF